MKEAKHNDVNGMSDLEIKWHEIEKKNKKCYKTLLNIARVSCRHGYSTKAIQRDHPVEIIKPAVVAGFLTVEEGKARFKDERIWLFVVCKYLVVKVLLRAWRDDKKLWIVMRAIYLRGYNINCEALASSAIQMLHNRHGIDVFKRVRELCTIGKDYWNILNAFEKALPKLKVEAIALKETLRTIEPLVRNDLGTDIYHAVEELSRIQADTGETLYQVLVAEKKGNVIGFIPCVLRGMSKNDFGRAYAKATELLESNSADLIGAGIIALGSLDYQENSREGYLKTTFEHFQKLKRRRNAHIAASLVKSYGRLLKYSDESKSTLVQLSKRKTPEVLYEIAVALSLNTKEYAAAEWFRESLMNLSNVSGKYAGVIQRIDGVLSRIAKGDSCYLVTSFWETWVVKRDYGKSDRDSLVVFEHSLSRMIREFSENLMICITRWFNSDDHRLHLAAADLVGELCHKRSQVSKIRFELDRDTLKEMTFRDVIYVIYKILGYASLEPEALCEMVFSVAEHRVEDETINQHIVAAFRDYISYNYPGTTAKFLEEKTKSDSEPEARIAKRILDEIETYYKPIRELVRLREFEPPPQRVNAYTSAKVKHQSKQIWQGIEEKSVFMHFAKKIPLKAGSSLITERKDGSVIKVPMSHFSHGFEFPRGELVDPVGQAFSRLRCRNIKREELQ